MKIAPREQFILTVVAAALLVIAIVALLIYPSFSQLGKLDTEIAQSESDVSSAKTLLAQRQAIKNRASQTDAKWLALANQVPDNPDLPALIIELQDAAFDSGVQLVAVSPAKPASLGTYVAVPLEIEILGTWADTIDYMQRIAKLSRGLRIVTTTSAVTDNGAQASKQNAELSDYFEDTRLNLEAYMIPTAAATPTATAVPAPAAP